MKADEYKLMVQAVETGVMYGWNRARKYDDNPVPEHIQETIVQAVINEICEWFSFPERTEEP